MMWKFVFWVGHLQLRYANEYRYAHNRQEALIAHLKWIPIRILFLGLYNTVVRWEASKLGVKL